MRIWRKTLQENITKYTNGYTETATKLNRYYKYSETSILRLLLALGRNDLNLNVTLLARLIYYT